MNQSVINLSSIDMFSLCISSRFINNRRVKSLFCCDVFLCYWIWINTVTLHCTVRDL